MQETNKRQITADILVSSSNDFGQTLTTFIGITPRHILAEINTHRAFTRNSASSRAVPYKKMMKLVKEDPFTLLRYMKDHTGMQGNQFFSDEEIEEMGIKSDWLLARDMMLLVSSSLAGKGLSKQFTNRLLEPFMWHTILLSATEWSNFIALRADGPAEIHFADFAHKILNALNDNKPTPIGSGWHLPFGDKIDLERLTNIIENEDTLSKAITQHEFKNGLSGMVRTKLELCDILQLKISTARSARTSYINFDGKDDYIADATLHDDLLKQGHMSPFEHPAKGMNEEEFFSHSVKKIVDSNYIEFKEKEIKAGITAVGKQLSNGSYVIEEFGWCGNYRGFMQYRKFFNNENKLDSRLLKH